MRRQISHRKMEQLNCNSLKEKTRHVYTVSEITQEIKIILESGFAQVWVEGEVSNYREHPSGHLYFSLKDKTAVLSAAIFNYRSKGIKFKIENGLKVVCFGRIDVYPPHGGYKMVVEKIEPQGIGSLQLALEQLKQKLEKEGLFAIENKRPLPYLPSKIGIITSLSGAAIKDILKVLDRRFADIHVIIHPAQVQGETAKFEIAQAINQVNRFNETLPAKQRIEALIVGRGGGSAEDLWAFNEEIVARAIYHSKIPVISAVGHERDVTIADLVADKRAATPSQAAELIVPEKEEIRQEINDYINRLYSAISHILQLWQSRLEANEKKLSLLNPLSLLIQHKARILDLARQIYIRAEHFLKLKEARFKAAAEKLSSLSPLNILSRGYSITFRAEDGAIIKEAKELRTDQIIRTKLYKGEILSRVTELAKNG
ncbi:MAG: exodeoxyribonuclease VII large subunit [Candidatus Omnitrophica bacterium]|nr:exodeoxyribonuclease VII large subunit [Candidatus Omnitrophota bacterium]